MSKIYQKILATFLFISLLIISLNFLVNNVYTHRIAESLIKNNFSEYSELDINFKSIDLSVVPLELKVYGLKVSSTEEISDPIAKLAVLQLQMSWLDIFLGHKTISKVVAHDLETRYSAKDAQAYKFLKQSKPQTNPSETGFEWPLKHTPVKELVLLNSRFFGYMKSPETQKLVYTDLNGVDLRVKFDRLNNLDLDFIIASANVYSGKEKFIVDTRLAGELSQDKNYLKGKYLRIKSKIIDVKGSLEGTLHLDRQKKFLEHISLLNTWKGTIDLDLLKLFMDLESTKGSATGSYVFKSILPIKKNKKKFSYQLDGDIKLNNASLDTFNLFNSETKFSLTSKKISFNDLKIIKDHKTYGLGSGSIGFNKDEEFSFDTSVLNMPLSQLLTIFDVDLRGLDLNLTTNKLSLRGYSSPFYMRAQAQTKINKMDASNLPPKKLLKESPECHTNLSFIVSSQFLRLNPEALSCNPKVSFSSQTNDSVGNHKINYEGIFYFDELKGLDIKLQGTSLPLELASYFTQSKMSGSLSSFTQIKGAYDKIEFNNELVARNVQIEKSFIKNINGFIDYKEDSVHLKNVSISQGPNSEFFIYKSIIHPSNLLLEESQFYAKRISKNDLVEIFGLEDIDYNFTIAESKGIWQGPLSKPVLGQGNISFEIDQLSYLDESLARNIKSKIQSNSSVFSLNPIVIQSGDFKLKSKIDVSKKEVHTVAEKNESLIKSLGFQPSDKINIHFETENDKKSPKEFSQLPFLAPYLSDIELKGRLKLEGHLAGDFTKLSGEFNSVVKKMSLLGANMPNLRVKGNIDGKDLEFDINQLGKGLDGHMKVSLTEDLPYNWDFSMNNFDYRSLLSRAFYKDPRNYAYLSGRWKLSGSFKDWWASEGELLLDKININYKHDLEEKTAVINFANREPATLLFDQNGLTFKDDKKLIIENQFITSTIDLKETQLPKNTDLVIDSRANLEILKDLSDLIEDSSGTMLAHTSISGPLTDLKITSRISSLDEDKKKLISLSLPSIRPEIKNMSFKMFYNNGNLIVENLEGEKGQGKIKTFGNFVIIPQQGENSRLQTTFNNIRIDFPVPYINNFDTILSGDIQLTGSRKPYNVLGDIHIDSARSNQKIDLIDEVISTIKQNTYVSSPQDLESHLFNFNVNILADKSIIINNNTIQANLSSNIQLQGHENKAIIIGHMNIDEGKFNYKRSFDISRGIITFDDQIQIDPKLDIIASTEILPYTVTIAISETASNPVVEILVDPPTRDNNEIITPLDSIVLLSTGKLPNNRNSNNATSVGVSEFINILGSQSKVPFEKFSEIFGKDIIRVYPDITINSKGQPSIQINGDINITENIEAGIKYIPDSQTKKAEMEIPFHENISFSGSLEQGSNDESSDSEGVENRSVDLRFKFPIK